MANSSKALHYRKKLTPEAEKLFVLQRGLTGARSLAGKAYMEDPALLKAYTDYYSEVTKAQLRRIISLAGIKAESVLDMGCGPGALSMAFLEHGASKFCLLDASGAALALAKKSLKDYAGKNKLAIEVEAMEVDLEKPLKLPSGKFKLLAFAHVLNEIGQGQAQAAPKIRLRLATEAACALAPGGRLLVMEPASLTASRDNIALRDSLLNAGWTVVAPCTTQEPCPALLAGLQHSCHDEACWEMPPMVRQLSEQLGLDRGLVKMSWFLMAPPGAAVLQASHAGRYRIVSAPMLNKGGRVRYLLCGKEGRFSFSAKKDDKAATAGGFFDLKRYDLISVSKPEPREGGWGFGQNTEILL
ncbi:hypothetical protein MASR2M29_04740 [Spirochaetota bacterium]